MKYLKYFENKIDFDDWDYEEEEEDKPFLKVGDNIIVDSKIESKYWFKNIDGVRNWQSTSNGGFKITDIKHSSDIDSDGNGKFEKGSIPYDGYMYRFRSFMSWYVIDPSSVRILENIDWTEDWEEEDPIDLKNLKRYYIDFETDKECIEIAKKLKKMGYDIYDYRSIVRNMTGLNPWVKFNFRRGEWCQSTENRPGKDSIDYKTFMENY